MYPTSPDQHPIESQSLFLYILYLFDLLYLLYFSWVSNPTSVFDPTSEHAARFFSEGLHHPTGGLRAWLDLKALGLIWDRQGQLPGFPAGTKWRKLTGRCINKSTEINSNSTSAICHLLKNLALHGPSLAHPIPVPRIFLLGIL